MKRRKTNAEEIMATTTKALEKISSRYDDSLEKMDKLDENQNLVEMIYTMLQSILMVVKAYVKARITTKDYSSKI